MTDPATPAPDRGPGVRLPPPLIFTLGLAAGGALQWLGPDLPQVPPGGLVALRSVAALLGLASVLLLTAALGGFRRRGTDPRPWRPDSALVVDGIYRRTRNPMYLGMALLYAAIALGLNAAGPLLLLPAVLAVIRWQVIAREEAYLGRLFGPAYADYCRQVPRWV